MASQFSTAVIVGSLRKESFSLKIAKALTTLAPPSLQRDVITLNGLSFYNQDLQATPPADWVSFRDRVRKTDAVLFVTPEYNRSVPGVLKNAIDVGSRPQGEAFSTASRAESSAIRRAQSAVSAPIIICASRWFFSTFRFCSSRKLMSAVLVMGSMKREISLRPHCARSSQPMSRFSPPG